MGDGRLDRVDRPRDEGVYSERIERDKKEGQKFSSSFQGEEKKILMATFFSYLRKMFDTFSPSKKLAGKVVDRQKMLENLSRLKTLFNRLAHEDLSTDPLFAISLSETWEMVVDDFDQLEVIERRSLQELAQLRDLIEEIKNYPPDSDHRLGYYLLKHAGKDWIPFPFLEMLAALHKNSVDHPQNCILKNWTERIAQIESKLKSSPPKLYS